MLASSLSVANPKNQNDLKTVLGEPKSFSHTLDVCWLHTAGLYLEREMGGIPPKLATCPPKFWREWGQILPIFDKIFYSICAPPLFWDIEGDFPLKIWNLDTTLRYWWFGPVVPSMRTYTAQCWSLFSQRYQLTSCSAVNVSLYIDRNCFGTSLALAQPGVIWALIQYKDVVLPV